MDGAIHYGALSLIHGTVLALITWWLSATLLRRSRPAFQAALWTIVLLKFLLPPVLPGEMALSGWLAEAATSVTFTQRAPTESAAEPIMRGLPTSNAQAKAPENQTTHLLFVCYLFFVVVLSTRAIITLRRTARRIRALPLADSSTRDEVQVLAGWIGLKRVPDVRMTKNEMTPYVFGFRKPVLVLPERLMQMLDTDERQALMLHELAHICRKDGLIRGLQGFAGVLFFFFPPVVWVNRRVEHFMEMACDSWAVTVSELEPSAYAGALVKVVKEMRRAPQTQAGLPLVRGVKLLEERLRMVLRDDATESARLSASAKVILAGWSLFVLMGGSTAEVRERTPNTPQVFANRGEETSSPNTMRTNNESPVTASRDHSKGPSRNESISSSQSEPPQQQAKRGDQDKPTRLTSSSRESRLEAERRASESRSQSGRTPQSGSTGLGPYEEGYLLGSRYAQESARKQETYPLTDGQGLLGRKLSEPDSKRVIEMRMQELTKRPSRQ